MVIVRITKGRSRISCCCVGKWIGSKAVVSYMVGRVRCHFRRMMRMVIIEMCPPVINNRLIRFIP